MAKGCSLLLSHLPFFFGSAILSRYLSRILYVFFWCFRWASYLRGLCSTSGTIRWNTRTGISICFDMIFNYIKVGMLTVFLSSEVEYENVLLRFSQFASNLKMFFSQRFVSCEEKIFDICLKSVKRLDKWTQHTSASKMCFLSSYEDFVSWLFEVREKSPQKNFKALNSRSFECIKPLLCECFLCKKVAGVTCFSFLQFHFCSPSKWFSWMLRQIGESTLIQVAIFSCAPYDREWFDKTNQEILKWRRQKHSSQDLCFCWYQL